MLTKHRGNTREDMSRFDAREQPDKQMQADDTLEPEFSFDIAGCQPSRPTAHPGPRIPE
jgi:hypothetical protein